jgi:hypothetical protein
MRKIKLINRVKTVYGEVFKSGTIMEPEQVNDKNEVSIKIADNRFLILQPYQYNWVY